MKKIILINLLLLNSYCYAESIYSTFTVEAEKSANLAFSYSGIVKEVNVDIMSEVKTGDVLATLISDDLIATHKMTLVELKYAKLEYERHKELLKKNLIDKSELDRFALSYETLKEKIELEKSIFAKTILTAPFDGVITEKLIEQGDVVSGQMIKTVFNIQSQSERLLILEFDQKYNKHVHIGDIFNYKIDGDDTPYSGSIYKIYPSVNSNNRKIRAQVKASNLKTGMFGEGFITPVIEPASETHTENSL